ncbi:MAG: DNA polymerase III subunit delta [Actinobacteria bacterium]|uniref:DNA-directed DNA polymerase n=1 Tax=freshwater metagenome TaxID=449393 RepID=A0A6J5ZCK9_9ZZZZ|nr:DNA polymerase III subunit delta [Actinomycetota bacterium]MSX72017.1 DNA polymerase III subunit delta [Actinomycetota bacterium]MSY09949.1 DNA polymerase III subunit delta [Actinomycetota bacterium]MSY69740.1 DNA polymerase III subunit delta [Actinomycetota bacterium]
MNSFYLILGSEGALSDRALTKLTAQLHDEKCEITNLFASDVLVGDIADALAPSLFSERRALIIRDLQDLPEDSKDEITRYLDSPDPSTTVVFVHKGGVKGKGLLDAIKKTKPELIACDPIKKEAEKEEFVRNLFLDLKRKATPGAISALVGALGNDLRELQSAISQIAADAPSGTIDEVMIDKFHQGRVETTGFDVADATLDGNLSSALIALRSALETGTDPVMITSAIASSLRSLAKVSGVNRAVKSFELAGQLGMAPWQIDKARRQLNNWSPAQIADAVGAIALADAEVKGAASDPVYALEKALTRITSSYRG